MTDQLIAKHFQYMTIPDELSFNKVFFGFKFKL